MRLGPGEVLWAGLAVVRGPSARVPPGPPAPCLQGRLEKVLQLCAQREEKRNAVEMSQSLRRMQAVRSKARVSTAINHNATFPATVSKCTARSLLLF